MNKIVSTLIEPKRHLTKKDVHQKKHTIPHIKENYHFHHDFDDGHHHHQHDDEKHEDFISFFQKN